MRPAKRSVWLASALAGLLLIGSLAFHFAAHRPARLNIILVTLDTTRADHIGCYGYRSAKTPALDALAERGVRFERAYTPVPLTLPSHASLMTGLYPPEHGLFVNGRGRLDNSIPVLAETLRAAGYKTAAFVAAFVLDSKFGLDRGFQTYDDDLSKAEPAHDSTHRRRNGDDVMSAALEWLQQRNNEPYLCWIHLFDAHAAYDSRQAIFGETFVDQPYDAGIAFADLQLQRLVDFLHSQPNGAETLLIVVGDHGEGLGEHHEDEHSFQIYESTMHVPLVIAGPDSVLAGHRVATPVSLVDLLPTILDCTRVPAESTASGRSLKSALVGTPLEEKPCYIASEAPLLLESWAPVRGVVTSRWKYIETVRSELYDLADDPGEMRNLAESNSSPLQELRQALRDQESALRIRSAESVQLSERERKTLESLGYASRSTTAASHDDWNKLPDVKDMMPFFQRVEEAKHSLGRGELVEAASAIEHVLEEAPGYASAHMLLGDVRLLQSQFVDAAETYRTALADRPDDPFLLSRLGSALAAQGQEDAAIEHYRQALEIDPEFAQCHLDLGLALLRLGKLTEAQLELEHAIRSDPALLEAHLQLGRLMAHFRRGPEAIRHYEAVLKLQPDHTVARLNLASALSNQGRVAEAVSQATQATERDPQSFEARFHLASILLIQNRGEEAAVQLRAALRIRPDDPQALGLLERLAIAPKN